MSQALYRKWRSQKFSELIGQNHISKTLQNSIKTNRLSHAYLFCGPRGTGKTSTARIFAKALNCTGTPGSGEPCNKCDNCLKISAGNALDVIEIDAASHTQVDKVREFIINRVNFAPSEGKYKIYIIDEVHKLSNQSFNALLKTLEEPPAHVIFILATTHPQDLLPTILSRCQRFDFRRIPASDIARRLLMVAEEEGVELEEGALHQMAQTAEGSMRDALVLLEQAVSFAGKQISMDDCVALLGITAEAVLFDFSKIIAEHNTISGLMLLQEVIDEGKDFLQLNEDITEHFRRLLLIKVSKDARDLVEVGEETFARLQEHSRSFEAPELLRIIKILLDLRQDLRDEALSRLLWEIAIIKLTKAQVDLSFEGITHRLSTLEKKVSKTGAEEQVAEKEGSKKEKSPASPPKTVESGHPEKVSRPQQIPSDFKEMWHEIMQNVKKQKVSLHAWLLGATPLGLEGNIVKLGFGKKYSLHREQVLKEKPFLEKIIEEIYSTHYNIECEFTEQVVEEDLFGDTEESHEEFVKKAADIFNGQII